jgi:hypothetical protein
MKGHGPFTITLQDGRDADFTNADFEISGAIITVLEKVAGHGEDAIHVYKQWREFRVDADNVEV